MIIPGQRLETGNKARLTLPDLLSVIYRWLEMGWSLFVLPCFLSPRKAENHNNAPPVSYQQSRVTCHLRLVYKINKLLTAYRDAPHFCASILCPILDRYRCALHDDLPPPDFDRLGCTAFGVYRPALKISLRTVNLELAYWATDIKQ